MPRRPRRPLPRGTLPVAAAALLVLAAGTAWAATDPGVAPGVAGNSASGPALPGDVTFCTGAELDSDGVVVVDRVTLARHTAGVHLLGVFLLDPRFPDELGPVPGPVPARADTGARVVPFAPYRTRRGDGEHSFAVALRLDPGQQALAGLCLHWRSGLHHGAVLGGPALLVGQQPLPGVPRADDVLPPGDDC